MSGKWTVLLPIQVSFVLFINAVHYQYFKVIKIEFKIIISKLLKIR